MDKIYIVFDEEGKLSYKGPSRGDSLAAYPYNGYWVCIQKVYTKEQAKETAKPTFKTFGGDEGYVSVRIDKQIKSILSANLIDRETDD